MNIEKVNVLRNTIWYFENDTLVNCPLAYRHINMTN